VVWPAGAPDRPRVLAVPGPGLLTVAGIDDDGTVVGTLTIGVVAAKPGAGPAPTPNSHAYAWAPDGTARRIPSPAGESLAVAVRAGWVLGYQRNPQGTMQLTRWDLRTGAAHSAGGLAYGAGINAHGWVVGFIRSDSRYEQPAFSTGDTTFGLPVLDQSVRNTEGPVAVAISDDGRALGGAAATSPDTVAAVRWTCT